MSHIKDISGSNLEVGNIILVLSDFIDYLRKKTSTSFDLKSYEEDFDKEFDKIFKRTAKDIDNDQIQLGDNVNIIELFGSFKPTAYKEIPTGKVVAVDYGTNDQNKTEYFEKQKEIDQLDNSVFDLYNAYDNGIEELTVNDFLTNYNDSVLSYEEYPVEITNRKNLISKMEKEIEKTLEGGPFVYVQLLDTEGLNAELRSKLHSYENYLFNLAIDGNDEVFVYNINRNDILQLASSIQSKLTNDPLKKLELYPSKILKNIVNPISISDLKLQNKFKIYYIIKQALDIALKNNPNRNRNTLVTSLVDSLREKRPDLAKQLGEFSTEEFDKFLLLKTPPIQNAIKIKKSDIPKYIDFITDLHDYLKYNDGIQKYSYAEVSRINENKASQDTARKIINDIELWFLKREGELIRSMLSR